MKINTNTHRGYTAHTSSSSLAKSCAQVRKSSYLEKGMTGSGSSRRYNFSKDATVWTSVLLQKGVQRESCVLDVLSFISLKAGCTVSYLPVKQRLVPAVEGLLQLFDQVGLSRHPKQTLLVQSPLPDEVHALLHQQRGQPGAKLLLILYGVL